MRRIVSVLAICGLFCVGTAVWGQAIPSVVDQIPSDVRGFAVLRNLEKTFGKVESLAARYEAPLPPLKAMLSEFDDGLNMQGDVGVAWLDGREGEDEMASYMHFVVFLPVNDFDSFVAQFEPADPDAEIVAISFNGQEFSLAKKNGFAIVADVEESASIQHVLTASASISQTAKPLTDWIPQNDLTVSITPKGAKLMFAKLKEGLAMVKGLAMQSGGENAQMIESALGFYQSLFDWSEAECEQVAIGLRVDPNESVGLHKRVVLREGGSLFGADPMDTPSRPLAGLPDGPYLVSFEGAMPKSMSKEWMAMSFNMLNKMQPESGKQLSDETVEQLSELASQSMKGLQSMAFTMGVGDMDEGMYSQMVGLMRIDDAKAYLENYEKSFAKMTDLMKEGAWADAYQVERLEVEGKSVVHLVMDMAKFQMVNAPAELMEETYQKLFGNDGKMSIYLTDANDSTVVMAYTSVDNLKRALEAVESDGLAGDEQLQTTAAMLSADAQWAGYIDPGGIMQFGENLMGVFAPGGDWEMPEFPLSPPVGFAVELTPTHLDAQLVVPLATVDAIKDFAMQMQ